ncbi:hypothetical protein AVU87_gp39 [Mycobacterium phage Theia]|uniref:Uncharacterized protein n=1 Tax=Mycobacterium phage Theia TaxID=1718172 RepID=A0A0N7GFK3_9CAUD|nr:hypothetical protein AVU87_gp39 [Mycobacterium phage Theia]ALH46906.1 hypothetical protein SEA_THEIA_54 [Mycobacterium phage Theia]AXC33329.1 hypothetical protein SEA_DUBLIN_55 [Mycobacterium phage Dublin]QGJ92229.1 hypothetical protein SEA_MARYSWELL_55 [Mycobacterium phage MarysWell]
MSSTTFEASFKEAFKKLLIEEGVQDVDEVVSVEEDTYYSGYCETCYYEEQIVRVHYLDTHGAAQSHAIWDTLSNLINDLLKEWPS